MLCRCCGILMCCCWWCCCSSAVWSVCNTHRGRAPFKLHGKMVRCFCLDANSQGSNEWDEHGCCMLCFVTRWLHSLHLFFQWKSLPDASYRRNLRPILQWTITLILWWIVTYMQCAQFNENFEIILRAREHTQPNIVLMFWRWVITILLTLHFNVRRIGKAIA